MKAKFLVLLASLLPFSFSLSFGQPSITLDSVDGLWGTSTDSTIKADGSTLISFYLRITSDANSYDGITNGFRIYSPDGVDWDTTFGDTFNLGWLDMFDLVFAINDFWGYWGIVVDSSDSIACAQYVDTGSGFWDSIECDSIFYDTTDYGQPGLVSDTVGFGGAKLFAAGLPSGFDSVAYSITIGPISTTYSGKTICLDSSFYGTTGSWKWAGPEAFPSWDGPHCFTCFDPSLDVTAIEGAELPKEFALSQNYPNPFNPTTQINFDVPTRSNVTISIYNVLGQRVKMLVNEELDAGQYFEEWNGTNDAGVRISSGLYFYKMEAGDFVKTKKMMMLK